LAVCPRILNVPSHSLPPCSTCQEKRKNYKKPTRDEFKKKYAELKKLQQEVFEMAFRLQDDELQAKKGQPSLEDEDTGVQWKNDVPGESA
jgi:Skp family chaperone for outer membrane proteins